MKRQYVKLHAIMMLLAIHVLPAQGIEPASVLVHSETGYMVSSDDKFLCDGVSAGETFFLVWSQKKQTENDFYPYGMLVSGTGITGQAVQISSMPMAGMPRISYDGNQFLAVWCSNANEQAQTVYGQFIDKTGSLVGSEFMINSFLSAKNVDDIVFNGTNYLVVWTDERSGTKDVYGQIITPSGQLSGTEIAIATGPYNQKDSALATDGNNFLVTWNDGARLGQGYGEDILGHLIASSGSLLGNTLIISQNEYASDNPMCSVYDGERYLVVWMDETGGHGSGEWDLRGQFLSSGGTRLGTEIVISDKAGGQMFPSMAFDNEMFVIVWSDMRNDINKNGSFDTGEGSGSDIYGQCIDKSGALIGSEFTVSSAANDQVGAATISASNGYKVFWTDNRSATHGNYNVPFGDIYGASVEVNGATNVESIYPSVIHLEPNRPNPFNPNTIISFTLPESGQTTLLIYNLSGQLVRSLVDGQMPEGRHSVVWDGRDDTGNAVSSGCYISRLVCGQKTATGKMVLVK